ncbi:sensor histidine kinase [Marinomonas ostreistagni]|uniref:sensor histidine kinase n=1 Tax=Marinomonas ostreistagni TaxID=359209 RepID=UPI00194F2E1B|nr:sensor histidine kinase [Marinomonas ostreistagni]MBM6550266.1 sensor histidine kinase [Marinomonas ostreistagni]
MTLDEKQLLFKDVIGASVKDMRNSLGQVLYKLEEAPEFTGQNQQASDALAEAQYEVIRIENVVNQLHGLYLLENDSLAVQRQETYLYELVEDVVANMGSLLQAKQIDFSIKGEDICWYVDPYLLSCVLQITLLNAIRYTKDRIAVSLSAHENGTMISVIDNGQGYPDSVLESFQALVAGEAVRHISSQNTSWLYCERIAALHVNQGKQGYTRLSNDGATGGGRIDIFLP